MPEQERFLDNDRLTGPPVMARSAALLVGAPGSNRFSGNNSCNTRYTLPPPITTRR